MSNCTARDCPANDFFTVGGKCFRRPALFNTIVVCACFLLSFVAAYNPTGVLGRWYSQYLLGHPEEMRRKGNRCIESDDVNRFGPVYSTGRPYFEVSHSFTDRLLRLGLQANNVEKYASCLESVRTHLRRSEKDLGSEFSYRMDDEWSTEVGPHWLDVAHVHIHSPLAIHPRVSVRFSSQVPMISTTRFSTTS